MRARARTRSSGRETCRKSKRFMTADDAGGFVNRISRPRRSVPGGRARVLGITLDGASVFAKILIGAPARGRPCYRKRDFSSSTFANERFNLPGFQRNNRPREYSGNFGSVPVPAEYFLIKRKPGMEREWNSRKKTRHASETEREEGLDSRPAVNRRNFKSTNRANRAQLRERGREREKGRHLSKLANNTVDPAAFLRTILGLGSRATIENRRAEIRDGVQLTMT